MSGAVVNCVTEPCVTSCPDVKMVVYPPPICLTLPGLSLTTDPGQCLVETQSSCLTSSGSDGRPPSVVTKSSGVRAISGGDTPCHTTTCRDSQVLIYPPPVTIIAPGATLATYPNECLVETSSPCVASNGHPHALTAPAGDGCLAPHPSPCAPPGPGERDRGPCYVTQGASHRVTVCPPPIVVTMPGPIMEVAAEECVVEVHTQGEGGGAECDVQTLRARVQSCAPACVAQGAEMTMVIQPRPIQIDVPGPILKTFPESCQVSTVCAGTPQPAVESGGEFPALCAATSGAGGMTNGGSIPALCGMKRPLPQIRRPSRPWGEMYSRSITPRSMTTPRPLFSRSCSGYQPAY